MDLQTSYTEVSGLIVTNYELVCTATLRELVARHSGEVAEEENFVI